LFAIEEATTSATTTIEGTATTAKTATFDLVTHLY